ncbi:MAG TPA: undecaprenyl-diphosphate phosphatase [Fibrobacteria bacterium]|nr:undecaprenyl-diphosphate phosphatase [Fibrobacteria bacterium]
MLYVFAILIGILEGVTEFVPVSSTGHMIIAGHLLGFTGPRADAFEIFIQLGAILAVVGLYRERFLDLIPGRAPNPLAIAEAGSRSGTGDSLKRDGSGFTGWRGLGLLALTTFPALVAGKLAHHFIKEHLFNPITVAIGLAVGGAGLILVEVFRPATKKAGLDALGWKEAVSVGLFQCLALWPGMSRAGSTIIGGMLTGIDRKTTAEYSFLAAVPLMFAATFYDLYKSREFLQASDAPLFALGFLVSLVSAWLAIRFFIRYLANHTLKGFGWYRLAVAAFTLWYFSGRQGTF